MDTLDPAAAAIAEYYRTAAGVIARQLAGRAVHVARAAAAPALISTPDSPPAVADAVRAGARSFLWEIGPRVPMCVRVSIGEGTDIATAATAGLAVIETAADIGGRVIPATDGRGGLLLYLIAVQHPEPLITELARRAPEIATTDPAATDGRALLSVPATGALVPVPYSLVDAPVGTADTADPGGADKTGVVLPLAVDELAAVTAGMPLELGPGDLPARLATHGDLAEPLAG